MKSSAPWGWLLFAILYFSCDAIKKSNVSPDVLAGNILKKPEPITTSFADVSTEKVLPDDFGDKMKPIPLDDIPRGGNGGFLLRPGLYEMTCKSYCLHPGTAAPGKTKGDGYLYAPLKGDKAPIIQSILKNSATKNAWQQDVQALIWAVLAKASFKDMSPSLKEVATQLLSKNEIAELNKNAIGVLSKDILSKIQAKLPPAAKKAMELENKMREQFAQQQANYAELEKLAVLPETKNTENSEYKRGRWSYHSDGYYIRYFPNGYKEVRMQIYMPPFGSKLAKKSGAQSGLFWDYFACTEVNPTSNVAQPANNAQQRLATSSQPSGSSGVNTAGSPQSSPKLIRMSQLTALPELIPAKSGSKYAFVKSIVSDTTKTRRINVSGNQALAGIVNQIATSGDNSGALTEQIAAELIMQLDDFVICPSKVGSNNGLDVLGFKSCDCESVPEMVVIAECKPVSSDGRIELSETVGQGAQMGLIWIAENILLMQGSSDPITSKAADNIIEFEKKNKKPLKLLFAVDKKTKEVVIIRFGDYTNLQ